MIGSVVIRIRNVGFILWQSKHMVFHILLGLLWVWFLWNRWDEFAFKWVIAAIVGSLVPDLDHVVYFLTYGKKDAYTKSVVRYFKNRQWRVLATFLSKEHKHNTSLTFHNYYTTGFCMIIAALAWVIDWELGVVLFGSMASHFLFDIAEDVVILRRVNPNWRRWGSVKV